MNTNANTDIETIHLPSALPYTPDPWTLNNNHQRPEAHSDLNGTFNTQTPSSSSKDKDPLAAFYSSLSMPMSIPAHVSVPVPNSAASFSSISSWYDPLESIISSTSTSLTNSPSSNMNMSTNTNIITTTTLNDQLQQQFLLDTHPHDMHFMNNINNNNNNNNNFNTDIYADANPNTNNNTTTTTNLTNSNNSNSTIDNFTVPIKQEEGEGGINGNQLAFNFFTTDLPTEIKQESIGGPVVAGDDNDNDNDDIKDVKLSSRPQRKRLTPHQKQAHNKIEKRYRININTKIARLQQIIPWVSSEQTAFEVSDSVVRPVAEDRSVVSSMTGSPNLMEGANANDNNSNNNNNGNNTTGTGAGTGSTRLNKSMILEKAVDYILYLQNNERLYEMEVARLRQEVQELRRINDVANSNTGNR